MLGYVMRQQDQAPSSDGPCEQPVSVPTAPGAAPSIAAFVGGLQRTLSNRQLARLATEGRVLAREPVPAAPPTPLSIEGPLGLDITNTEQLAAYFRLGTSLVEADLKRTTVGESLDERARLWAEEARAWGDYLGSEPSRAITQADIDNWKEISDEGTQFRKDIQWVDDAPVRRAAEAAAEEARRVAAEVQRLAPMMADAARAAFRSGDEGLLTSLADITGNITDIGLGIHELAREISEKAATLTKTELPAVGKYTEALGKLNTGLSIINLAISASGDKGKTDLDEGLRLVGFSAGAFSSLGTIVGLPAHMGLYANLYLVPLTKACIAGIQRIGEHLHEENKSWIELIGKPGYFSVEPGGEAMWHYMVSVMRAKKFGEVAEPSDEVAQYFVTHADSFNAGVGGYDKLPTTGWVWTSLDKAKFTSWVYFRRKKIWALLYGSMSMPR